MCGIAGFYGGFDREWLSLAVTMLVHRGPDDSGIWFDERAGIGLAHTRLAIIDLSPAGHQPMTDATGRFTIVYNGEVYNYRELRGQMEADGVHFRSDSDTEVVLELFARQREAILPLLNGIFAFAIWDRYERLLFLARDALGVKPLYFTEHARGFAFASELKTLMPFVTSRTLDLISLHRYLTFLWCPGEGTPLREVRRLPPGEAMLVSDGRMVRRWRWFELPVRRGKFFPSLSPSAVVGAVREGLRQAVHRQLVADVPVGAFLSGGLDSSAVITFAREQAPDIQCFTIELAGGQEAGFADDLPYARRVAQHLDVHLEVVTVDAERMVSDLEEMVWLLDEPQADPAPLNVLYISRLAREHGVPVLLSGTGGDDLFSGYRRHLAIRYQGLWARFPAVVRKVMESAAGLVGAKSSFGRRLQRFLASTGVNEQERITSFFIWIREGMIRTLYSPDFVAELNGARADEPLLEFLVGIPDEVPALERMLALEQRFFLADHNLLYTDKMSMSAGVEVRVPFLDLELIELAAYVPVGFKQRGRSGKWVLKEAMRDYLPDEVINRPKTGFGAPLRRWLRRDLRPLLEDVLSAESLNRRGLFDAVAVQELLKAHDTGRIDAAYSLFALICIELWCRTFLDRISIKTKGVV